MNSFLIFIFSTLFAITSGNPTNFREQESINRLSDIGMHPHIHQNLHVSHKKIKRAADSKVDDAEFTNSYWINQAKDLIKEKVKQKLNIKKAKNIILFIGDGMSHNSIAAARVYQGGESSKLAFETFPNTASSKTFCVDKTVADSACSGTAFLHGVKTNYGVIGLNAMAERENCNDTNNKDIYTSSIASWFMKDERNAGIVTTTRITDATPAALYANIANRDWEGNEQIKKSGCDHQDIYDIAEQLIRGSVGSNLKVMLGGGSKNFINTTDDEHGISGSRTDGKNLIKDWLGLKSDRKFIRSREELMELDATKTNQLFGLFHSDHIPFHLETISKNEQSVYPTLTEMSLKAIDVLSQDEKGYFLLIEGGRIDHAHHENKARLAIEEVVEFSKAIQAVLEKVDLEETLIIVTADHSHVMTVAGYSPRGNDIFSAPKMGDDGMPYYTISYGNGPGFSTHVVDGKRVDPKKLDSSPIDFQFPAVVPLKLETHGGEDVGLWAIGPNSHVFKGSIEQNLIAHLMAYASCVGEGLKFCD